MRRWTMPCIVAAALFWIAVGFAPVRAQTPSAWPAAVASVATPAISGGAAPAAAAATQPATDRAALGAFVDGVVRAYMTDKGIAGATVAVVDRDGPLLLRGYGMASEKPKREVDPASTMFRIGSISKTFTYVAAMQLVAAGKLDLDAPIDQYLPTALKTADSRYLPIRIWHLMTHSAGFEDGALDAHLFYADPAHVPTLEGYLAKYRPHRVRAPAVHADYSNYSVALLGAIVARVSGEPFEAYVERHILTPLGMAHTTFREPLGGDDRRTVSKALAGDWSIGFKRTDGGFEPQGFEYISPIAPAGAGSTTAADMATWMRMLLGGGAVDEHRVLDPIAFKEMTTATFDNAPAVHAIAHGFFVGRYGQYTSLEHGGDTIWFHSNMVVLPQAGLGVFISTNTDTGYALAYALPRLIFERLLPGARPQPAPTPPAQALRTDRALAGLYVSERRAYTTLEKGLNATLLKVSVTRDGHLVLHSGDDSVRYVQVAPDVFRAVQTSDRVQFLRDARGRVTGVASAYGHVVYDRAGFFDSPNTILLSVVLLLLVCLCALIGAWGRRGRRSARGDGAQQRALRAPARAMLLAVLGWLAFFVLAAVALMGIANMGDAILFRYPTPLLRVAVIAAYVAALLSLLALLWLPRVWGSRVWSAWRKLRHTAMLTLMLWAIVLLVEWKVLLAPLMLG